MHREEKVSCKKGFTKKPGTQWAYHVGEPVKHMAQKHPTWGVGGGRGVSTPTPKSHRLKAVPWGVNPPIILVMATSHNPEKYFQAQRDTDIGSSKSAGTQRNREPGRWGWGGRAAFHKR